MAYTLKDQLHVLHPEGTWKLDLPKYISLFKSQSIQELLGSHTLLLVTQQS